MRLFLRKPPRTARRLAPARRRVESGHIAAVPLAIWDGERHGSRETILRPKPSYARLFALLSAGIYVLSPSIGHAYIGPGAGLSAIGALLALVAVVIVTIVGFVWFPVKRLLRNRRKSKPKSPDPPSQDSPRP